MIRADRASDYIRVSKGVSCRSGRKRLFTHAQYGGGASSGGVFAIADPAGGAGSTLGRGSCAGREMKGKLVVQET